MDISVSKNGYWELDADGMRAVILGKVAWKKCYECEGGKVFVSGGGDIISAAAAEYDEYSYVDMCENCYGVGLLFVGDA